MKSINQNITGRKKGFLPVTSWQALIVIWLVFLVNANCRELINRVAPAIVYEYKVDAALWGLLYALLVLSVGVLTVWGSAWSDRVGQGWLRKKSNIIIMLAYVTFTIVCGIPVLTTSIYAFMGLSYVRNAAAGIGESVECTSVAEWFPAERRGFAFGAHHTAYPWGSMIGGVFISAILANYNNDWRLCFILVPLIFIPIWIIYWLFATPKRFKKFEEETIAMGLTPTVKNEEVDPNIPKAKISDCFKNPNIIAGMVASFCAVFSYVGIIFWLTPYLAFIAKYDFSKAAAYSVIFGITGGIGQIVWGTISDRIGRKRALMISFTWLAVAYFIMQFVGVSLGMLIFAQLFAGCCTNAVFPLVYSLLADSADASQRATATSMSVVMQGIGGAFVSLIFGALISIGGGWQVKGGYITCLYIMVAVMILGVIYLGLFCHETCGPRRGKDWALTSFEKCGIERKK